MSPRAKHIPVFPQHLFYRVAHPFFKNPLMWAKECFDVIVDHAQTIILLFPFYPSFKIIGSEESYGDAARSLGSREVVLWLAVKHSQKVALEIFAREIAPGGTGMGRCSLS